MSGDDMKTSCQPFFNKLTIMIVVDHYICIIYLYLLAPELLKQNVDNEYCTRTKTS